MAVARGVEGERQAGAAAPRASVRRLGPMQRIAAERLARSHLETAPVTLLGEAECDALVALREQINAARAPAERCSFTHLLVKLLAQALREHPGINCALIDGQLHQYETVNLGVAIALPDGNLVVPVLRDAGSKPLAAVVRELGELEARAAAGRLTLADVSGGTFTLSNAGSPQSVRWTTPILLAPQCAILGTGAVRRMPVARGERVELAWMVPTSLTFDHRAVNGLPASRFVETLHGLLGAPGQIDLGL